MSAAVSFKAFCERYKLDQESSKAKAEYDKYKEQLELANSLFSEKIASEAIDRMGS